MFTGIVAETGKVSRVERSGQGIHLKIHAHRTADRIQLGDSLAVNGCCLTVVEVQGLEGEEGSLLGFDLLQETCLTFVSTEVTGRDLTCVSIKGTLHLSYLSRETRV